MSEINIDASMVKKFNMIFYNACNGLLKMLI